MKLKALLKTMRWHCNIRTDEEGVVFLLVDPTTHAFIYPHLPFYLENVQFHLVLQVKLIARGTSFYIRLVM